MDMESFCSLVQTETGLDLTGLAPATPLDSIEGWSSIMAVMIASGYQRVSGRKPSLVGLLQAHTLQALWIATTEE